MKFMLAMAIAMFFFGCAYKVDKGSPEGDLNFSKIGFAEVKAKILAPKCIHCHGEAFSQYESVLALKDQIANRISLPAGDPQKMPLGEDGLTPSQIAFVLTWISKGAPRVGTEGLR